MTSEPTPTLSARPFHEIQALSEEKGRDFPGLFIPTADGLALEDAIAARDAEITALRAEVEDYDRLTSKQAKLLTDTANALRGKPPEEVGPVSQAQAEIARLREALERANCEKCFGSEAGCSAHAVPERADG